MSFQDIYDCAIKQDILGLNNALNYTCIDVRASNGFHSPVSLLAQEGKTTAVNWLLENNASKYWAVFGYAAGGHITLANSLIDDGATKNWAVKGYARGGYTTQVNTLLDKRNAEKNWAIVGYALGGHISAVNSLIDSDEKKNWAVKGYAVGGHIEAVSALIASGASKNWAVFGYALGGRTCEVDVLISSEVNKNFAVRYYSQGGHVEQVNALITNGADINEAVHGYAYGGHTAEVTNLITRGASKNIAVQGYAIGRHIAEVNKLVHDKESIYKAFDGYVRGGHLNLTATSALRIISLTSNNKLKEKIIGFIQVDLNHRKKILNKVDHVTKLMAPPNNLSFYLAQSYFLADKALYIWLIDCRIFFKENKKINYDLFFEIALYFINVSRKALEKLSDVIHERLLAKLPSKIQPIIAAFEPEISSRSSKNEIIKLHNIIHKTATTYEKLITAHQNLSIFYPHGKITAWLQNVSRLKTRKAIRDEIITYLSSAKDTNPPPNSFKAMLLDNCLELINTTDDFKAKLEMLSIKWKFQEPNWCCPCPIS